MSTCLTGKGKMRLVVFAVVTDSEACCANVDPRRAHVMMNVNIRFI
jgi:hypothetical protein